VNDCVARMMVKYRIKATGSVNALNLGHPKHTTMDEVVRIMIREMKPKGVKRPYSGGAERWIRDKPSFCSFNRKDQSIGLDAKDNPRGGHQEDRLWAVANS
jgi:hypothetical protein